MKYYSIQITYINQSSKMDDLVIGKITAANETLAIKRYSELTYEGGNEGINKAIANMISATEITQREYANLSSLIIQANKSLLNKISDSPLIISNS